MYVAILDVVLDVETVFWALLVHKNDTICSCFHFVKISRYFLLIEYSKDSLPIIGDAVFVLMKPSKSCAYQLYLVEMLSGVTAIEIVKICIQVYT